MANQLINYRDFVIQQLELFRSNVEIARRISEKGTSTTEATVRRLIASDPKLQQLANTRKLFLTGSQYGEEPGIASTEDEVIITSDKTTERKSVDKEVIADILKNRKLDPEEWEVRNVVDNSWEANAGMGEKITLYQHKVWLVKKVPVSFIFPATPNIDLPLPKVTEQTDKPILAVVCGDQQAPHINERLHDCFLQWLEHNKPEIGVITGDLVDWNTVSRHKKDPGWDVPVQESIQSAFDILYQYRQASPNTKWKLLKGNHDQRLRDFILEKASVLYNIAPANYPGDEKEEWVFSLNHLLHLDKLGIEYVEVPGTYEFEQVVLSDLLSVRHGHRTGNDASIKTASALGHSVVLGHTHSASIKKQTVWNSIAKTFNVITAIETGCMCRTEGGIGFASAGSPDWQNGAAAISIWPDGNFSADLLTYTYNGTLYWRDQVFTANAI